MSAPKISRTPKARTTLIDLIKQGHLAVGDIIYNIAHNSLTKKQDRLYAAVSFDAEYQYYLTVIDGQIMPAGTRFKTLNSFMRAHLNEKILRGETERLTTSANIWEWTFTEDGRRFREFRCGGTGPRPAPTEEEAALFRDAISYCEEFMAKYCSPKAVVALQRATVGILKAPGGAPGE